MGRGSNTLVHVLKGLGVVVGITVLLFVLVTVSVVAHAQHRVGRRAVADLAEWAFDRELHGSLEIDEIASFWPRPFEARGVVVRDTAGNPAMRIERARVWMHPWDALGTVQVRRVRIEGATLWLVEDEDGDMNIERAFQEIDPDPDREERAVELRDFHAQGIRLAVESQDAPRVEVVDLSGFLSLTRDEAEQVTARFENVSARLAAPTPLGIDLSFEDVSGWVDETEPAQRADVEVRALLNDGPMEFWVRYYPDQDPELRVDLRVPDPKLLPVLAALGLDAAGIFIGDLSTDVNVEILE